MKLKRNLHQIATKRSNMKFPHDSLGIVKSKGIIHEVIYFSFAFKVFLTGWYISQELLN